MVKKTMGLLASSAMAMLASSAASAATITFGGFGIGNFPVTTYSEAGFTVTRLSGTLLSTSGNGNGAPSIFSNTGASFSLTNGGLFNFASFQGANGAFTGTAGYTVTGFLAGLQLFSTSYSTAGTGFTTFNSSSSATVDSVRFDLAGPSVTVDNIVANAVIPTFPVGAVPEPASWAMMMLGLGIAGGVLRRRQSVTTRVKFA